MADVRKQYGSDVQHHRRHLGFSQTELADIIGISQSSLSHIETGRRSPSFRTLTRIRRVIDILEEHIDDSAGARRRSRNGRTTSK